MKKDDVIRMARESGMEVHERKQQARFGLDALLGEDSTEKLMRFAEIVRKQEREACAQLCEQSDRYRGSYFAQKIRERG